MEWPRSIKVRPWVAAAGRSAMRHGVYVYAADDFQIVLGTSNGSLGGLPLVRCWLTLTPEAIEDAVIDLADYAAREIRDATNAGYVMRFD